MEKTKIQRTKRSKLGSAFTHSSCQELRQLYHKYKRLVWHEAYFIERLMREKGCPLVDSRFRLNKQQKALVERKDAEVD